jgi:Tol biopolymer transport system component
VSQQMRSPMGLILLLGIAVCSPCPARGQTAEKRAITFKDLISIHRVSDPQISPDGLWVAYTVATPDLDANRSASNIWIIPTAGGDARQLTRSGRDLRPRWSPDGKTLAFLSSRDGTSQVYSISLAGGEPTRLTFLTTGADNELWSPDGRRIAFISAVFPDCKDDACNSQRAAEQEKSKVRAHVYEKLLYRHWTTWSEGKRSHLFIAPGNGGAARDLTPGADYDVPPFNLGEPESISFSPASDEICFTANTDKDEALSTNGDLFLVPTNGSAAPRRITSNPADARTPNRST